MCFPLIISYYIQQYSTKYIIYPTISNYISSRLILNVSFSGCVFLFFQRFSVEATLQERPAGGLQGGKKSYFCNQLLGDSRQKIARRCLTTLEDSGIWIKKSLIIYICLYIV